MGDVADYTLAQQGGRGESGMCSQNAGWRGAAGLDGSDAATGGEGGLLQRFNARRERGHEKADPG
eukprot:605765-Pleurochrysis_carterae.AAC.1